MLKNFTSGHLGLEHLDHVVEVARASHLGQHVVELGLGHELADVVEGGAEVVLGDGAILGRGATDEKNSFFSSAGISGSATSLRKFWLKNIRSKE
jgi:hypothetical protein